MLKFKENSHQYFYAGNEFTSVTKVISSFKQPFDTDFWSTYKALESLLGRDKFMEMKKYRNFKSPAFIEWACSFVDSDALASEIISIKNKWKSEKDKACFKGTFYHDTQEKKSYKRGFEINPYNKEKFEVVKKQTKGDKESFVSDLFSLPDGYYPELMIWNNYYKIAGTADRVFIKTIKNKRFVDIDDYKTNKEIKKTNSFDKMKYPLHKLDDCNYNHYRVQISIYAWMMEQFGYQIRYTGFTHINEKYKFQYSRLRKTIKKLLEEWQTKNLNR